MKKTVKEMAVSLLVVLPAVFVLIFLGYFPVHYDIVLYTDNIVGDGICQSYGSQLDGRTSANEVTFYFGSELKKATINGFYYDIDTLHLVVSDVSSFDILGIDSYIKGIHLTHVEPESILPEGEKLEGTKARLSTENDKLHVEVFDPDEGATIKIARPFIPAWFWAVYFGAIFLIAFLVSILLVFVFRRLPVLKLPLMSASCIVVTLLAGCFFCGSLSYISYTNFLLNWALLYALTLAVGAITVPHLATVFTMAFTTFWYIANYFVIALRNKPIMPSDLKVIGTAAEVMGGYTFAPSWKMVLSVAVVLFYAVMLVLIWKRIKPVEKISARTQIIRRVFSASAAALLLLISINTDTFKSLSTFAWDTALMRSFHEQGMVLAFLKSAFNSQVKEPEGYSRELVNSYLSEYTNPSVEDDAVRPTRIIMVMNEAFSDLRTVGLNRNIDVMPFIDSLDENTVEGNLYVSIFGGGTCNTEFEALTGNTLAFLGAGAYPYTEYVTKPLFSLASYFANSGYSADAFHANLANNWNRNRAYPNLGFEAFHSIDDYEAFGEVTYLHNQPADISDYLYIEAMDSESKDHPRFLFCVTMQNHSGYERWLDVEKAESVAEHGNDLYVDSQIYLSLVKASDDAVRQLVEFYQNSDEPTMIVFFGDHQPGLPNAAMNEIYSELKSNLDFFKSKFFIWTNYDIQEWHNAGLSANYMPWLILERGNFPLPPYVQMLKELYAKYPIISSQGVMDINGNIYTGVAEVMDDPLIQKYQYIQYANLFDELDPAWFAVN